MADLKTTYKDDVLNTSANEKRKYNMITNEDGTVSLVDVTDYLQVGDSFGAADVNATNKKVNELNTNLGGVLLWSNPSPSANFATQNITLVNDNYDVYEVFFKTSKDAQIITSTRSVKGFGTIMQIVNPSASAAQGVWGRKRSIIYVSDSKLKFEDCYVGYTTQAQIVDNSLNIPLYIIGYKTNAM